MQIVPFLCPSPRPSHYLVISAEVSEKILVNWRMPAEIALANPYWNPRPIEAAAIRCPFAVAPRKQA